MPETRILLGVVGRPHGVRGLLHVHSYTADPADLAAYAPLTDERGGSWTVTWRGDGVAELRDGQGRPVADRTAAEKLVNTKLYVARDRLPPPDDEEFYLADLVGLLAVDAAGQPLGQVSAVHDYGAGASLEIGALLVPFTRACVPEVDLARGRVVVAPPAEAVKTLREALAGNRIQRVSGILNGTCNYILSRMETERLPFHVCLKEAQRRPRSPR